MLFFRKKYSVNYNNIISILEGGNREEISKLLWQPKSGNIEFLPITFEMIQRLKKDFTSDSKLSIYETISEGKFELIIFNVPWKEKDFPYAPIIIDKSNEKIVGLILPFNELFGHLPNSDDKKVGKLGMIWTQFAIKIRFNLK